jgi:NlpC/P60 family
MHSPLLGARAFIPVVFAGILLLGLAPATPAAASEPQTEAQQIIQIAKNQLGDPWRLGATGPSAFDCSGLVIYAFTKAGDRAAVGSGRFRTARELYRWYQGRGLASRTNPKPGDLVVWGSGTHIGIYIGNGKAISTLSSGVRIHDVHAVTAPFTAYLHTRMSTRLISGTTVPAPVVAVTPPSPVWIGPTLGSFKPGSSPGVLVDPLLIRPADRSGAGSGSVMEWVAGTSVR